MMTFDIDRIKDTIQIPEHRIWNIYLYGSRVYGNHTESSDYDLLVLASSINAHTEYNDGEYNIHVRTKDVFQDQLWKHQMNPMECMFAPDYAKLQERVDFGFIPKISSVKRTALSQSHSSWNGARFKMREGDIVRGMKSMWHSIRMLQFALQIVREGTITDFSVANECWTEINESEHIEWKDFKGMLLPRKRDLERELRQA